MLVRTVVRVSVTGQTVVETATVTTVVLTPLPGQLGTVGAQLVMVDTTVEKIVEVVWKLVTTVVVIVVVVVDKVVDKVVVVAGVLTGTELETTTGGLLSMTGGLLLSTGLVVDPTGEVLLDPAGGVTTDG